VTAADTSHLSPATQAFRKARDFLLNHRYDYDAAVEGFAWPQLEEFNWARDHFDVVAADPATAARKALWIVEEDGTEAHWSYAELAERSNRLANWLRRQGVARGDRLILMLGNQLELWETILAAIKLGAVLIPTSTLLGPADLADRLDRGHARHVVTSTDDTTKFAALDGSYTRICVGVPPPGWLNYAEAYAESGTFSTDEVTRADDTLLLYFTSGTTSKPKLVEHTHASYPVGHLSTMYWVGLRPGDVHLNVSSPGWAKHAWSSVFAPWNAEATIFVYNYRRFDAAALLGVIARCGVTTFCAPPTVWRMLIQSDLSRVKVPLREVVGAGEPLNPEVIEQVQRAWGLQLRDGFGQTETTVAVANTPGQSVKSGSMGRPVPGYSVTLVDPITGEVGADGEICLELPDRPLGLMVGYAEDSVRNEAVMAGGHYRTGDIGSRDAEGYITYVGRSDDVFKASDYRISPFELESVLIEHPAVAEAAVVPSPDSLRLSVPKAYVILAAGHLPDERTARSILGYAREHLAPHQRIRRLEFADLPKTISGKIRRVDLRGREEQLYTSEAGRPPGEWRDEDFPDLRR
jgi:acetyl-CoA synthetase